VIVTCQNCDTSFQLDESRVPAQGIRVRCSRCKEAFFLAKPSAKPEQAIHGIAAEAARSSGSRAPTATQDLEASNTAVAPSGRSNARPAVEEEEHDWEFNLDPPAQGSAKPAKPTRSAEGDLAWEEGDAGGSGLSLAGEDETSVAPVAGEPSAFGSVDDFSSLMEGDGDQVSADVSVATRIGAVDRSPARGAQAAQSTATGRRDELGDPENWDFFGEPTSPVADSNSGSVLGRIALTSIPAAHTAQTDSRWADDSWDDASASTHPGTIERSIMWLGQAIGWATTALLASVVTISGFWTTAQSIVVLPQEVRLGEFEARDMTGRWIDTARGETLLRVTGELSHAGASDRALGGLLEVALLDADGRRLPVDPQPAGVALPVDELRELTPAALRIVIDRAAFSLAHEPIGASKPVAFQAIFQDVPGHATRFALSIADRPANMGRAADSQARPMIVEGATALLPGDSVEDPAPQPAPMADGLIVGE
jgi:predicted Zn finger-like uncharacterized protein